MMSRREKRWETPSRKDITDGMVKLHSQNVEDKERKDWMEARSQRLHHAFKGSETLAGKAIGQ